MELASYEDRAFATRLMEYLVVPTFVIDAAGRVMIWNRACERLTGVAADEIVGTTDHWRAFHGEPKPCLADLVLAGRYKDIKDVYASFTNVGFSDHGVSAENWCVMPAIGHRLYLAIDAGPIYDSHGHLTAVVETLRDITIQKQAQIELEARASRDGLTGLLNRRSFDESLANEARRASRDHHPLSLLMVDIDCFKQYNDTYGHQKGDECLRRVADALNAALWRAGDAAARYGGEEFAVILPDTSRLGAAAVAERMRAAVIRLGIPHTASTASDRVTVSVGGATIDASTITADALLTAADAALYRAKHAGRNRSYFPQLTEAA
jgi:diguanylate cyclase (GGDEF)-like protein/PAS domain S-box-containing protein